jgi:hypothetical protein
MQKKFFILANNDKQKANTLVLSQYLSILKGYYFWKILSIFGKKIPKN